MHYALGLAIGFWAIVGGLLVGFWIGWWPGGTLIVLGLTLIGLELRRAMNEPDDWETLDDYISSL
jgi:hypothetical protein